MQPFSNGAASPRSSQRRTRNGAWPWPPDRKAARVAEGVDWMAERQHQMLHRHASSEHEAGADQQEVGRGGAAQRGLRMARQGSGGQEDQRQADDGGNAERGELQRPTPVDGARRGEGADTATGWAAAGEPAYSFQGRRCHSARSEASIAAIIEA
jgi:hypothetical protein